MLFLFKEPRNIVLVGIQGPGVSFSGGSGWEGAVRFRGRDCRCKAA